MNKLLKIEEDLQMYKETNKTKLMYNYIKNRLDKSFLMYINDISNSYNNLLDEKNINKTVKQLNKNR